MRVWVSLVVSKKENWTYHGEIITERPITIGFHGN